jgi:hypothetical protein
MKRNAALTPGSIQHAIAHILAETSLRVGSSLRKAIADQFEKITLDQPVPGTSAATIMDFEIQAHRRIPGRDSSGWIVVVVEVASHGGYKASVTVSFNRKQETVWLRTFPVDASPASFARQAVPGIVKAIFEARLWQV